MLQILDPKNGFQVKFQTQNMARSPPYANMASTPSPRASTKRLDLEFSSPASNKHCPVKVSDNCIFHEFSPGWLDIMNALVKDTSIGLGKKSTGLYS